METTEQDRTTVEAAMSERALSEIYLRGYEIAVKEGNAKNILSFIMESPAMLRQLGRITEETEDEQEGAFGDAGEIPYFGVDSVTGEVIIEKDELPIRDGEIHFCLEIPENGSYAILLNVKSELSELAQLPVSLYVDNLYRSTYSFRGTNGKYVEKADDLGEMRGKNHFVKLVLQGNGLEINSIRICKGEKDAK